MLNRRALSDVVEAPGRRREETRVVEMVRVGQALKLEAIVRGLAPTSLATVGPLKPRPWEPRCIYPDFAHTLICGDVWSENKLILATDTGTYLVEDGFSNKMLFDKTVQIKQLDVVEQHGILLFRAGDKGRESNVYVYRLSEMNGDEQERFDYNSFEEDEEELVGNCVSHTPNPGGSRPPITRTRSHVKERKLDKTRGCHLYSLAKPGGSHLRMCVVVGRRLTVLQWKHNAAWTTWCSSADTDTIDGFLLLAEYNASEQPSIVTIIESTEPQWLLCCGLRHHFELISADGSTRMLQMEASIKPHIVAALDLCEDEEPELLLCYNNTCHFQKLSEDTAASTEFDFNWNSVPIAVTCAFPYVIAFTVDTMEIRLIINGNLVHTISMPNLTLITSKKDIYFSTTTPEFLTTKNKEESSLPASQSSKFFLVLFVYSNNGNLIYIYIFFVIFRCSK